MVWGFCQNLKYVKKMIVWAVGPVYKVCNPIINQPFFLCILALTFSFSLLLEIQTCLRMQTYINEFKFNR